MRSEETAWENQRGTQHIIAKFEDFKRSAKLLLLLLLLLLIFIFEYPFFTKSILMDSKQKQ
jgi:hypothetical protein